MQKWYELLQKIIINDKFSKQNIFSSSQLADFEAITDIMLPQEYKYFCQIFGSGRFGDIVTIYTPSLSRFDRSKQLIDIVKQQIKEYPSKEKIKDEKLSNWLDSTLLIGDDDRGNIAVYDLASFDNSKKTYDIYWIQIDDFNDEIFKISSDFFDFVNDFCLGNKQYDFLPEYIAFLGFMRYT